MTTKQWVKKDGTVVIKTYDQNKYNANFYNNHKEELTTQHLCECGNHYTIPNKTKHFNTKIHKLYERMSMKLPN